MVRPDEDSRVPESPSSSWRDRALERSLRTARAKAVSRSDQFVATAMEILQETGRTDFTVQELVERSRTSLRSFYQYFAGKDELLLAILEERLAESVQRWRHEAEGLGPLDALQLVVTRIYGEAGEDPAMRTSRALSVHHLGLVHSNMDDYLRALAPVGRLIRDLIGQGVDAGVLRSDMPKERLTLVIIQTVVGAAMVNVVSARQGEAPLGDADALWEFCRVGLLGAPSGAPKPRTRAGRR